MTQCNDGVDVKPAPQIVVIAALDRCRAIGRGNALPWHLPADLKRFKKLTMGKPMLMGRKTAESLGRALPGRLNLVLTRSGHVPFAGMVAVASLADALQRLSDADELAGELMVIGGGEVYALALPHAARLHLTHVETEIADADAWFPAFDPGQWGVISDVEQASGDAPYAYRFTDYQRL